MSLNSYITSFPPIISLYKMNIKDSPRCDRCHFQNETLVHMFCECPDVKIFWKDALMWWNTKRPENIDPNSIEVLYGYKPEITSFYALNHYLLVAKYHVYLARNQSETPCLQVFLALLESKIKCERQMAIKNSNLPPLDKHVFKGINCATHTLSIR